MDRVASLFALLLEKLFGWRIYHNIEGLDLLSSRAHDLAERLMEVDESAVVQLEVGGGLRELRYCTYDFSVEVMERPGAIGEEDQTVVVISR